MKDFNQFQNCILSTRPTLDALSDCNVLKRKGIKAYPSPSMVIKYNKSSIINFKYDAIIFTSRHAVKIALSEYKNQNTTFFCVGSSTAKIVREHGGKKIFVGNSDSLQLSKKIVDNLKKNSKVLWITSKDASESFSNELKKNNISVDRENVYFTSPNQAIDFKSKQLIKKGRVKVILFFSTRSAEIWLNLVKNEKLLNYIKSISFVTINHDIAELLSSKEGLNCFVAKRKRRASVLAKAIKVFKGF